MNMAPEPQACIRWCDNNLQVACLMAPCPERLLNAHKGAPPAHPDILNQGTPGSVLLLRVYRYK